MYTRPRHTHQPIPSISTLSPYPSPSQILNKSEDITWQTCQPPFLPCDPITHPLPSFPPPPPLHIVQPLPPPQITRDLCKVGITKKPTRKPHLPAEKNAALKAAKIAKECHDMGAHTTQRFKCPFSNCNKFFQRRYNFKVHVRKHTNETPYTCDHPGCGKKFRWRSSISHHIKAHNNKRNALGQHDIPHMSSHLPMAHPLAQHPLAQHPLAQHPLAQHPLAQHPLGLASSSVKVEDTQKRRVVLTTTPLPTSPISSGTANGNNDRFQGFGLEHVGLVAGGDVGMDELNFDHEHVTGMMFDNTDIM